MRAGARDLGSAAPRQQLGRADEPEGRAGARDLRPIPPDAPPHPSGPLAGLLGTALAVNLIALLLVVVLGGYFYYCSSVEERNLTETFPTTYPTYRASTKRPIPCIL